VHVQPLSPARVRHAHPADDRSVAVVPVASVAAAAPAPTSSSLRPFLLVLISLGILLLGAAVAPVWRIQQQLRLVTIGRALDRHQLDLALGGAGVLVVTVAVYLLVAVQH
jgi:hypothetical protein